MLHEVYLAASSSQSATNRVSGKYQLDEQRIAILDAAETLFLESGIEKTTMIDIAERAGITRVTLYRYFANRDEVAVEVHLRLMQKAAQIVQFDPEDRTLEGYKRRVQSTIRNFPRLVDRYRYAGMFDQTYLDNSPDSTLTKWTFNQLISAGFVPSVSTEGNQKVLYHEEINVLMSTVVWFLEKLAMRGEMTWSDKEVPMAEHLRIFEDMMVAYFDRLIEARDGQKLAGNPPI